MQETTHQFDNRNTLVVIDSQVNHYQDLVCGLLSGTEVLVLDPHQDGIEQITQILAREQRFASVHILSHGSPGCLYLGNSQLSLDTLHRYSSHLQTWRRSGEDWAQKAQFSILLYGCNVAAGDAGSELVEKLSQLTGAGVAASANLTGSAALGGDWKLEVRTGDVEVTAVLEESVRESYSSVLATYNFSTSTFTTSENNATNAVTVTADSAPTVAETVVVSFMSGTAMAGVDFNNAPIFLTFNPGDNLSRSITIPVINDNLFEGGSTGTSETIDLSLTAIPGSTVPMLGSPSMATLEIQDDDSRPSIQISDVSVTEGNIGGTQNAVFTVSLSNPSTETITVNYTTANNTAISDRDYESTSGALTFNPEEISKQISVPIIGDLNGEPNETFFVILTSETNASISDDRGEGTILNDDNNGVVPEDDEGATLTNTPVSIDVLANDFDPDGSPINLFPIPFSTTSAEGGTVTMGSSLNRLVYTPPQNFNGTDTFTYNITDGNSTASATVTIAVSPPPPPNNAPVAVSDSFTINQGTPIQIDVLANDSDPDGDPISLVSFTAISSGGGIVTREGNLLTYTPTSNFTGNDGFQYVIQDSRGVRADGAVFVAVVPFSGTPTPGPDQPGGSEPLDPPNVPVPTPARAPNITLDTVQGTEEANILLGDANNNEFLGLGGNDLIVGLAGSDNLFGNGDDDILFANAGNDFLQGGRGNDQMFGGRDNDFLDGGLGEDTILGELGDDAILGGDGNDFLFGLKGNDLIDGGQGDDSIAGGTENDALQGSSGADTIAGGMGSDALQGGLDNDMLFGNADADALDGANGNDSLFGGQDADTLFGGSGNDRLNGNAGEDLLVGGAGSDSFVVALGNGIDNIVDFVPGEDTLLLVGGLTVNQLSIQPLENAAAIVDLNTNTILVTLIGVSSDRIGAANFSTE